MNQQHSALWEAQVFNESVAIENHVDLKWHVEDTQNTSEGRDIDPSEFQRIQEEHDEAMAFKESGNK